MIPIAQSEISEYVGSGKQLDKKEENKKIQDFYLYIDLNLKFIMRDMI